MQKKLLTFKGLYGSQQEPFYDAFVHHEPLQARSELHNWDIREHLHTELFQLFIFTVGDGILFSGGKKIVLNAPCVLLIPNSTLHGFAFQSNMDGDVLTFSPSFIEQASKPTGVSPLDLHHLSVYSFESASAALEEIVFLKTWLLRELKTDKPAKQLALQLVFHLLLLVLHREHTGAALQKVKSDNRMLDYFYAFQKQLRQTVHETQSIREYAKALNITPVHLNRICREVAQKSALQLLHECRIKEAQKYLLGTSYSVSEISYFLDFKDPAHFSKLFKKVTGMTPAAYRRIPFGADTAR